MKKYILNILKSYLLIIIVVSIPFVISCRKPGSDPEPAKPICRLSKYLEKKQDGTYGGYQYTYNSDGQVTKINLLLPDSAIDTNNYFEITYEGENLKKIFNREKFSVTDPVSELTMNFSYSNNLISSINSESVSGGITQSGVANYTYNITGDIETINITSQEGPSQRIVFSGYINGRPSEVAYFNYNDQTKSYDEPTKEKYTYNADNNLIKVEVMKKDETTWQISKEFKYDLKLPTNSGSDLLTAIYTGNDLNSNTKNKNMYEPNEYVLYSSICFPGTVLKKRIVTTTTVTKFNKEDKLPLEFLIKEDRIKCDGSIEKTETTTVIMRYECK